MIGRTQELLELLDQNKTLQSILERCMSLGLKNWYIGAGGLAQTVWNIKHRFDPENGIKDYDLVYYNSDDISYEAEDLVIQLGKKTFRDIQTPVEIRNQARVHLWYESHFGYSINQHKSAEDAISTWPTTATAVGIRKIGEDFELYAPFGLDDLLGLVVRANKVKITEGIYLSKVKRWKKIWPNLTVIPWK